MCNLLELHKVFAFNCLGKSCELIHAKPLGNGIESESIAKCLTLPTRH